MSESWLTNERGASDQSRSCRASGRVFTARVKAEPAQVVAIKQISFKQQPKKEMLLTEIRVMQTNQHKNLVNYIEVRASINRSLNQRGPVVPDR